MLFFYDHIIFILVSGLLFSDLCIGDDGGFWGYKLDKAFKGPDKWKYLPGSSCDGLKQSPIDIVTDDVQYWSGLLPMNFENKLTSPSEVRLHKSSTSVYLDFTNNGVLKFGNKRCLAPVGIHWHWGSVDSQGSEHTINGKAFPMEGHLIFYDCDIYSSDKSALNSTGTLYVIGVFYEIGENNEALDKIIVKFNDFEEQASLKVQEMSPIEFLPKDLKRYYRYEGSLTTPPCSERIIWTVMKTTVTIGKSQLDKFRSIKFSSPEIGRMVDNFRPVVPVIDPRAFVKRIVFSSFNVCTKVLMNSMLIHFLLSLFIWTLNI